MVGPAYLRSLAKLWKHPSTAKLSVKVDPRLTSTVARYVAADNVIELSPAAAKQGALLKREILCHEAAHFVVWDRHGRAAKPHGSEWRALVQKAGFEPKATLVRCGERRRQGARIVMFRHVCPVCQFSKRAKRRVPAWRCPECRSVGLDGALRIERVSGR